MMGSGSVKGHWVLSLGNSNETFFLFGLRQGLSPVVRAESWTILDLRQTAEVGVATTQSGVQARDETEPEGECRLGKEEEAAELERD